MKRVLFILIALFVMSFGEVSVSDGGTIVVSEDHVGFPIVILSVERNDYGRYVVAIVTKKTAIEYSDELHARPVVITNAYNDSDYIVVTATEDERSDDGIILYDVSNDIAIINFLKRVKGIRVSILTSLSKTGAHTTNIMSAMGFTRLFNNL